MESYFLKCNDAETGQALWLKFTILAGLGMTPRFHSWAVLFSPSGKRVRVYKEGFDLNSTSLAIDQAEIRFGSNSLSPIRCTGSLQGPDGTIRWDLAIESRSEALFPYPWKWMYTAPLPSFKTVSPSPDALCTGVVEFGDERWELRQVAGLIGHNWGKKHAVRYAWAHSNLSFAGENGYFEGFSAKIKVGPVVTPFISLAILQVGDRRYEFNNPGTLLGRGVTVDDFCWKFAVNRGTMSLRGDIRARPEAAASLAYPNPDGSCATCINSKTADAQLWLAGEGTEKKWELAGVVALETLTYEKPPIPHMI